MPSNARVDLPALNDLDSTLGDDEPAPSPHGATAFADMKALFQRAVENLEHRKAAWLRRQVRAASEPNELWLLRGPLLAALRADDSTRALRAELYRSLDNVFPAFPELLGAAGLAPAWQLGGSPLR